MVVFRQAEAWHLYTLSNYTTIGAITWAVIVPLGKSTEKVVLYDSIVQRDVLGLPWEPTSCRGENAVTHVSVDGVISNQPLHSEGKWTDSRPCPFFGTTEGDFIPYVNVLQEATYNADDSILALYDKSAQEGLIRTYPFKDAFVGSRSWLNAYPWGEFKYQYVSFVFRQIDAKWYYAQVSSSATARNRDEAIRLATQLFETKLDNVFSPEQKWRQIVGDEIAGEMLSPPEPAYANVMEWASRLPNLDVSELATRAYHTVNFFDSNGIAYAGDLATLGTFSKRYMNTIKLFHKGIPKVASNLFLGFVYGWKLLVADSLDLIRQMRRLTNARSYTASAVKTTTAEKSSVTERIKISYDPFGQIVSELERIDQVLDVGLDLGNMWDLIPYSFVVDWFVPIGNALTAIDDWAKVQKFCTFRRGTVSQKLSGTLDKYSIGPYTIPVTYTVYRRKPLSAFPNPQIPISTTPLTQTLQNHVLEGTALVVSKY